MTAPDDKTLLERIGSGTPEGARAALRELYERHAAAVLAFIRRLLGDVSEADDVLQETFMAASRHAADFGRGSARSWLFTIAGNRVRDELRRRNRATRGLRRAAAERSEPVSRSEESGDSELAMQLGRLPASQRAVLQLHTIEGLSHEETARVLRISPRTAKAWARRGLETLRERLRRDEECS